MLEGGPKGSFNMLYIDLKRLKSVQALIYLIVDTRRALKDGIIHHQKRQN